LVFWKSDVAWLYRPLFARQLCKGCRQHSILGFLTKKLRSVTAMAKNKKHLNGAGKFKKVNSKGPNGKKRKVNRIF